MTTLSEKIADRIKTDSIKPKPRWQFKVKEISNWLLAGLFIVGLGLITALLWYFLTGSDIDWSGPIIAQFPIFGRGLGMIMVLLFAVGSLSLLLVKKTKHGYKYNSLILVVVLLSLGFISGWTFNRLGYGRQIDRSFSGMPFYQNCAKFMRSMWQQPDQGRLAGQITEVVSPNHFKINDLAGHEWLISAENAAWQPNLKPVKGTQIKLLGQKVGDNSFASQDVMDGVCHGGLNGEFGKKVCCGQR